MSKKKDLLLLCTESHGKYLEGEVYKCKYVKYDSEYYEVFSNSFESRHAIPNNSWCDLNLFKIIDSEPVKIIRYMKHKGIKLIIINILNLMFKEKFKIDYKSTIKIDLSKINQDILGIYYMKIISPILQVQNSDFFFIHNYKVHAILDSISKILSKNSQYNIESIKERILKYSEVIDEIVKSIKINEEKISNKCTEQEDELLEQWKREIKDLWS